LYCQAGNARYSACLLRIGDAAAEHLALLRHHHAIGYHRPCQSCGERIVCVVPV
jgi:hypothetical protein